MVHEGQDSGIMQKGKTFSKVRDLESQRSGRQGIKEAAEQED
jgi:hypothetical protein